MYRTELYTIMANSDAIDRDFDVLDVTRKEDVAIYFAHRIAAGDQRPLRDMMRILLVHHHLNICAYIDMY